MKAIIQILNILLLSLMIYNFYSTSIEPYCDYNTNKEEACKEHHDQQIYKNDEKLKEVKHKMKYMNNNIKKIDDSISFNRKEINKNAINLKKMRRASSGKAIDNSEACEKHPEAC